jgi:hypothetical protein
MNKTIKFCKTMFHNQKGFHIDMGHVLLILALIAMVYLSVKKAEVKFGMCACPKSDSSSKKEGMSGTPDCGEMCDRLSRRDMAGYIPEEYGYTPL